MSRAVVLSGGGPVGVAWQTGIVAGLASHGVDLAEADLIVGTSAGSAVGAQLALGRDLSDEVTRYREAGSRRSDASGGEGSGGRGIAGLMQAMTTFADLEPQERRRAIGRFALDAETGPEDDFVATFGYLKGEEWPKRFTCTAIDAESGEFLVWDADAGVELDRAVASSCAVPGVFPPITIKGRRYFDGGMRSVTNADLAVGHDHVLVVSLTSRQRMATSVSGAAAARAQRYRQAMQSEYAALRESGAAVATLVPDDRFAEAIGMNLMDGSKVFTAVELGLTQAARDAARWRAFWVDGDDPSPDGD